MVTSAMSLTLCQRCKTLEFDDTALGGYRLGSEGPGSYLEVRRPQSWNQVHLDYFLQDKFPDLPALSETAGQGCGFCILLRASLREHTPSTVQRVEVTFCYQWNSWSNAQRPKIGLGYLKARIKLQGTGRGWLSAFLRVKSLLIV
jgi:hypothetical protein